ncbi:MAG: hypothetical protein VX341_05050 [Bdellovibrionota bacterium]|nr:hypothetical protein [Bdellovibrionota bacterium]
MKLIKLITLTLTICISNCYADNIERFESLYNEKTPESYKDISTYDYSEDKDSPCDNNEAPIDFTTYIEESYFGRDFVKVRNIISQDYSIAISRLDTLNSKYIFCYDKMKVDSESLYFLESNNVANTSKYYDYDYILYTYKDLHPVSGRYTGKRHALKLFENILIAELGNDERAVEIIQEISERLIK